MSTETLFRLRVPFQLLLVAFSLVLAWLMVRRGD